MSRSDTIVRQCREVVKWLQSERQPQRANDVQSLLIAHTTARVTMSELHSDNMELRKRVAALEWQAGHP